MKPLTKGDPCRVRLINGEVVEAVYEEADRHAKKCHWVCLGSGGLAVALGRPPEAGSSMSLPLVRFVGPACVLVPVGVSV